MQTNQQSSTTTEVPVPESPIPLPTVPLSKIDMRAGLEGRAIRVSNGYQLERPKRIRKSRKKYGGRKPEKQKKIGPMRYDGLLIADYEVPPFLKAMIDNEVKARYDRSRMQLDGR